MNFSQSALITSPDARLGLELEWRKTSAGLQRHAPSTDHLVTIHWGTPVKIACKSGERCTRTRGDTNVMPAGIADDWFEEDTGEVLDLRVPLHLVQIAAEELGLDPEQAEIIPRCHVRDLQIEHIAQALVIEREEHSPHGLLYRQSLGLALAAHLLGRHSRSAHIPSAVSHGPVTRVREYIDAHLNSDISLIRLARVAGMSTSHLRALFKRAIGVPLHEYVIQRRVERARHLLTTSDLPASAVAMDAGFSHQSHMARCMRRILGVSPSHITRPKVNS